MSKSDKHQVEYSGPISKEGIRSFLKQHMPDFLLAAGCVAVLTAIRLRSPTMFGVVFYGLSTFIRATPMQHGILVSIDGLPTSVWSLRIPLPKRFASRLQGFQHFGSSLTLSRLLPRSWFASRSRRG